MLKLMSFNIRYGLADDRENRWEYRKSLVIERIRSFDPDMIGMQECRDDFQAEYIKSNLPDYEFYGMRRAQEGDTALEMAPILYKRNVFQLKQKGHFWLSDTPQTPGSKSWGAAFPRTTTWVEVTYSRFSQSFFFLNTHFDYEPSALDGSANALKGWIAQNATDKAIILTGDFNADKDTHAYQRLTEDGLSDVYRSAHPGDYAAGTFHGYGQANEPIDWILATAHFEVIASNIDRFHDSDRYPSDHYPVTATLQWRGINHAY